MAGFLTSGHSDAQEWVSECQDIENCKWWLNPVWHRKLHRLYPYGNTRASKG